MGYKVLHLLGSPTDEFSFSISLMYTRSLVSAKYEEAMDNSDMYAVVHPGGLWSFTEDITQDEALAGKMFEVTEALAAVREMSPDLMIQHILCAKRPLYNAMFEILNIPFIGSSSQASANIADKAATRALLLQAGLPVPHGRWWGEGITVCAMMEGFQRL
jgi:D-alanine-D-alanine ligase